MENEIIKYELCALYHEACVREVTAGDLATLDHHNRMLVFFLHFEELFEIVQDNLKEFWRTLFDISENHRFHILPDRTTITKDIFRLNLRITNLLNSAKAYDDHLRYQLKSHFGSEQSQYFDYYNKLNHDVYDNSFENRLCVRLRNYTQHMRNPIDKISYSSSVLRKDPIEIAFTATPLVYKKRLLEYDGWSAVKKDIEGLDDEIDLVPIFDQYFRTLGHIHSNMRKQMDDIYQGCKQWVTALYSECVEYLKQNSISKQPSPSIVCRYRNGCISCEWIPFELIETVENFRSMNAQWSPAGLSFTSLQACKNMKQIHDVFNEIALRNSQKVVDNKQ